MRTQIPSSAGVAQLNPMGSFPGAASPFQLKAEGTIGCAPVGPRISPPTQLGGSASEEGMQSPEVCGVSLAFLGRMASFVSHRTDAVRVENSPGSSAVADGTECFGTQSTI